MFIPISTDTTVRRTPWVNYALVAANILIFLVEQIFGYSEGQQNQFGRIFEAGAIDASAPRLYEFLTYQFLHADITHIAGNMLFLWVFGNPVNAKMGNACYLLFYLAGGVFSAAGYAWFNDHMMIGASGAISAVTTAYLALFPRSYITVVYWWFFFGTFELPSMILIVFKIILWDNIISPAMVPDDMFVQVAFSAHLMGYGFGFAAVAFLLALRWLPRDQFDIVAIWKRWLQRQGLQPAYTGSARESRQRPAAVARPVTLDNVKLSDPSDPPPQPDRTSRLRAEITEALGLHDVERAAERFVELIEEDPRQVLPRQQQVDVANQLFMMKKLPQAVAAYEKYLVHYPNAEDRDQIKLLLGITYARNLQQYELAEAHLRECLDRLTDPKRVEQCRHWLHVVCEALGRPFPQGA